VGVQWYPLTLLSHLTDVTLFGLQPAGHHATSVVLHALNSVILFLALRALSKDAWPSAIVAALFAVHPLRVESVAWISERKDVLSGLFWMLGLWAWAGYARTRAVGRYLLTLILFACGLMSKPMVVTFPCVLLLLDWWPLARVDLANPPQGRRIATLILEKLPFFALAVAAGVATLVTQAAGGAMATMGAMPLHVRILNSLGAYGVYAWQTIVPSGLTIAYPVPTGGELWARAAGGTALILMWLTAGYLLRGTRSYVLVGGLWYLGVLAPVIGLLQVGAQAHADRYTYLSQVGLLIAAVWTVWSLTSPVAWARQAMLGAVVAACVVFSALTWIQIGHWRTSLTLFGNALAVTEDNSRAQLGYGRALLHAGRAQESVPYLQEAIRLEPGLKHPRHNLALAWLALGDSEAALDEANRGLDLDPDYPGLLAAAGTAALNLGRASEASERFSRLVDLKPEDGGAWVNLGIAQGQLGSLRQSEESFNRALAIDSRDAEALYNLGVLYARGGDESRGKDYMRRALEANPGHRLAAEALQAP
jgi:tetratricopeptide (TPR) repeat protein